MNIEEQDALTAIRAKVKELESVMVAQYLYRLSRLFCKE